MSFAEDMFKGPSLLMGLGAVVAAPIVLPVAATVARPLVKAAIKGSMTVAEYVSGVASETGQGVHDVVAEAKAEHEAASHEEL